MVVQHEDVIFSEDRLKKVFVEYGMTKESVAQDVAALKEWLSKQPHLPDITPLNPDRWLETMLVLSKNSLARAKLAIDNYFTSRSSNPVVFSNRNASDADAREGFDHVKLVILPGLTPDGHRVMLFQIRSEAFSLQHLMKRCTMLGDLCLHDGVDFAGLHVVHDLRHIGLSHLSRFSLPLMRSMAIAMKSYPIRTPKITILNTPYFMDKIISLFRSFMSPKLMSRISTYKDDSQILDILPPRMVPRDYGGEAPSLEELNDFWKERMEKKEKYFALCDSLVADENKRVEKRKTSSADFGQNGTFRQLSVD